ncbi:MAG: glycosyltransferase family 39 protein, partial [Anaerolineae bacterium]|nr:glycosyltransferase family 39 protein [Anaerolineae bacterium]
MKRGWHLATLLLILIVALGMRLYRLKDLPPGLFHDEAYNTLDADALARGLPHPRFYDSWEVYSREIHTAWPPESTRFPVYLEGNYGREALYHYFGALAVRIFGRQVWSLRLVSAVAGVLGVLGIYWVTRELFSVNPNRAARLGLLAAGVAAGVYSLLAFSRLGLRIITLVTLETLAIALWLRAARIGRWYWWASAGLLLGLSQYTYIPARTLPAIVALPTIVWYARARTRRRQLIGGCAVALVIALLVAAPLIEFFVRYPAYLTLRAEAIAVDRGESGLIVMLANIGRVFLGIFAQGDNNPILNFPGRPLLDVFQSAFFFLGLAVCLMRFTSPPILLILFWAAAMFAPSVVSGIAPSFGRSIGGVPSIVIIVALGIDTALSYACARWPRRRRWLTMLVVAI